MLDRGTKNLLQLDRSGSPRRLDGEIKILGSESFFFMMMMIVLHKSKIKTEKN